MVMVGLWLVTGCLLSAGRLAELRESTLDWVLVPAGSFTMGCTYGIPECVSPEENTQEVSITQSFYLSTTEITQRSYETITGSAPSYFADCPNCPVESVDWYEAAAFANAMSDLEGLELCYDFYDHGVYWPAGLDCTGFRLPTEAEWEYAARAGEDTTQYSGDEDIDEVGWYEGNSDASTQPVGLKSPNAWMIHDMSGNVWEWTWDWYDDITGGSAEDPLGPTVGSSRVARGGGWNDTQGDARLFFRRSSTPDYGVNNLGIRLARTDL